MDTNKNTKTEQEQPSQASLDYQARQQREEALNVKLNEYDNQHCSFNTDTTARIAEKEIGLLTRPTAPWAKAVEGLVDEINDTNKTFLQSYRPVRTILLNGSINLDHVLRVSCNHLRMYGVANPELIAIRALENYIHTIENVTDPEQEIKENKETK